MIDTTTAEFRSTVDTGPADIGNVTMRATVYRDHSWLVLNDMARDPALERGGSLVQEYLAKQEADPAIAQALAAMRRKIGSTRRHAESGLAMLRLNKGLSQLQLAQRLNTHQPAIARWERNPEQMTYSTICQIASALDVTEQQIFDATRQKPASAQLAHEAVNNEG